MHIRIAPFLILATSLGLLLFGCDRPTSPGPIARSPTNAPSLRSVRATTPSAASTSAWTARLHPEPPTRDLEGVLARKTLRVLVQAQRGTYLPRTGYPLDIEREQVADWARTLQVELLIVERERFEDLIPALQADLGDLIAANLTVTPGRQSILAFSTPVGYSIEQVVGRPGDPPLRQASDLNDRELAIQSGTSFEDTAKCLQRQAPRLKLRMASGQMTSDDILDRVASGHFDLTLEDSNILDIAKQYRGDIKVLWNVSARRPVAWGLRPDSPRLLDALNRHLKMTPARTAMDTTYPADWPDIKRRQVIRMITLNEGASYWTWRGEIIGFEYELAREFAKQHGLRLDVVVAPRLEEVIPLLLKGHGDFAAAFLTPTADRRSRGVAFTRPYHFTTETVVCRAHSPRPTTLAQLEGRTISVARSSSYWNTVERLKARSLNVNLRASPETMDEYELMDKVATGDDDLTVCDSHLLAQTLHFRQDVAAAVALGDPQPQGWMVAASSKPLLDTLNAFWDKTYRSTLYNVLYRKYFNPQSLQTKAEEYRALGLDGRISPYDALTRRYAKRYQFDWLLITAQMYQESRFNPRTVSSVGAQGLMQVMPKTGLEVGIRNLHDPEQGIHAGVKYLDKVRSRLPDHLTPDERHWFTLASYNAGLGHVEDAQRLAERQGLDPKRWFGQTEKAMLLLSKAPYARQARCGFVRGEEPVRYVTHIRDYYKAYAAMTNAWDAP